MNVMDLDRESIEKVLESLNKTCVDLYCAKAHFEEFLSRTYFDETYKTVLPELDNLLSEVSGFRDRICENIDSENTQIVSRDYDDCVGPP
jgi:hypothetical protein